MSARSRARPRLSILIACLAACIALTGCAGPETLIPDNAQRITLSAPGAPGRTVSALVTSEQPAAPEVQGSVEAPRVIFVHGTPGSAGAWGAFLEDPIPGLTPVAIDRPGFGQTVTELVKGAERSRVVESYEQQARAALAFAPHTDTAADAQQVILVGHSLGGPIVAMAAALEPERVKGIVILAGSLDPQFERPKWFNHLANLPPFSWLIGRSWRHSNQEIFAAREQTELLAPLLGRVRCRVVVVHGTEDSLVPVGNIDYIRTSFVNAESVSVVLLDGAEHFIPWTHEAVVREAVRAIAEDRPITPPEGYEPSRMRRERRPWARVWSR